MVRTACSFPCVRHSRSLLFDSETVARPNPRRGDSGRERLHGKEG